MHHTVWGKETSFPSNAPTTLEERLWQMSSPLEGKLHEHKTCYSVHNRPRSDRFQLYFSMGYGKPHNL
ncbi:hypothetical protein [Nostoc sp. 106C]|uniref:hypothetical protein n=1 Tax=Nostoc sp. 106C TaxID=1932667 RepID=UPI0011817046|nr:hypothetical protein [Nostoc sp. 106C]